MMRTAMTTADGVLTPETEPVAEPAVARRRRVWPRLLIGFLVGFALCFGLAGGGLLAYDANHEGRVLAGVNVGGVDLSGLDYAQASAALSEAFAAYGDGQVVVHTEAGDVVVPYRAFSRRADIGAMGDAAMLAGRSGTAIERAAAEVRLASAPSNVRPSCAGIV